MGRIVLTMDSRLQTSGRAGERAAWHEDYLPKGVDMLRNFKRAIELGGSSCLS